MSKTFRLRDSSPSARGVGALRIEAVSGVDDEMPKSARIERTRQNMPRRHLGLGFCGLLLHPGVVQLDLRRALVLHDHQLRACGNVG